MDLRNKRRTWYYYIGFIGLALPALIVSGAVSAFINGEIQRSLFLSMVIIGSIIAAVIIALNIYIIRGLKKSDRNIDEIDREMVSMMQFISNVLRNRNSDLTSFTNEAGIVIRNYWNSFGTPNTIDLNQERKTEDDQVKILKYTHLKPVFDLELEFLNISNSKDIIGEIKSVKDKLIKLCNLLKNKKIDEEKVKIKVREKEEEYVEFEIITKTYANKDVIKGDKITDEIFEKACLEVLSELVIEKLNEIKKSLKLNDFFSEGNVREFFSEKGIKDVVYLKFNLKNPNAELTSEQIRELRLKNIEKYTKSQ